MSPGGNSVDEDALRLNTLSVGRKGLSGNDGGGSTLVGTVSQVYKKRSIVMSDLHTPSLPFGGYALLRGALSVI